MELDEEVQSALLFASASPTRVAYPSSEKGVAKWSLTHHASPSIAEEGTSSSAPFIKASSSSSGLVLSSSSPLLLLSTLHENEPKQGERESTWPVERVLFTDTADVDNGEILIELSCERSLTNDEEEKEKKETMGEWVESCEGIPTAERLERIANGNLIFGVEEVRRRYAGSLTEAECENNELLSFLAWSEQREALKKRTLYAFWNHLQHSKSTRNEEVKNSMTEWTMPKSFPSFNSSPHESEGGAYRDIYLHAYALRDFSLPLASAQGQKCGAVSHHEVYSSESPPAVYVAPPAGKSTQNTTNNNPNSTPMRSLTPQSSPACFIEWISRHIDFYSDLVFPPGLALIPS
ncbi:unnamed protein product [Phytomonas sp. Hart1]|nr:unnamed protein product [Phytomonas sp. Hart1]|eukprot:CCW71875.1 unnamed protein product [Phytomonas sp. isolate Hart1]